MIFFVDSQCVLAFHIRVGMHETSADKRVPSAETSLANRDKSFLERTGGAQGVKQTCRNSVLDAVTEQIAFSSLKTMQ